MDEWSVFANYVKDGKMLVGKLFFDLTGFCFKADSVTGAINMGHIKYEQVLQVEYAKTFGFIPNGVMVVLADGAELRFTSIKRKKIKGFLESKMTINREA